MREHDAVASKQWQRADACTHAAHLLQALLFLLRKPEMVAEHENGTRLHGLSLAVLDIWRGLAEELGTEWLAVFMHHQESNRPRRQGANVLAGDRTGRKPQKSDG